MQLIHTTQNILTGSLLNLLAKKLRILLKKPVRRREDSM